MASARSRREELEGFREGLRHRLERADIPDAPALKREFRQGERALSDGALEDAERRFRSVATRLDRSKEEVELVEMPRGLVDYHPIGSRGVPPDRDEEPVSNRLVLVQRLLQVRRQEGHDVERLVRRLGEAEREYRAGHRARARALVDEVHGELDRMAPAGSAEG